MERRKGGEDKDGKRRQRKTIKKGKKKNWTEVNMRLSSVTKRRWGLSSVTMSRE